MKRSIAAPSAASGQPRAPAHGFFLEHDEVVEAHDHGESADTAREDALVGTAGSHAPSPDLRAEEPSADIASRAREGGP